MGQRSQIYVRYTNDKGEHFLIARYFWWNYGERMISRARHTIDWIKNCINYQWYFSTDTTKLIRIIDTNFDMYDVLISNDIVKEYFKNEFDDIYTFKEYIFTHHDNNNGKLFIDIHPDGTVKYAFLDCECNLDKKMSAAQYMNWDKPLWRKSQYISDKQKTLCEENIKEMKKVPLMTKRELEDFISCEYNLSKYMPNF